MQRRSFIKGMAAIPFVHKPFPINLLLKGSGSFDKVLVLGMDGMEISLLRKFIDEGAMPTFKRFAEKAGYFGTLKTTLPALSPVAWSSFITGCNPGRHGIFDFVARDEKTLTPFLATSITKPSKEIELGSWRYPWGGGTEQARQCKALWNYLGEAGISNSFFRLPGNYPCQGEGGKSISGMGTPDISGGYGTATLLIEGQESPLSSRSGSRVIVQQAENFTFKLQLKGPANPFSTDNKISEVEVFIVKDPVNPAIRLEVDGKNLILKEKEWSDWIPLNFNFIPGISGTDGMVQCFVRSVHPKLEIYFSPILIDPLANSIPTSYPTNYAKELAEKIGRFNTLGLPADTKSLSNGLLSDEEYLQQALMVLDENMQALDVELGSFSEGLLFFYFSSLDQNQHMLWRCFDPQHPLYDPNASPELKNAVKNLYIQMDKALAQALSRTDSRTLVLVLSDHGFLPFTREFELNSWLRENGYLVLKDTAKKTEIEEISLLSDVDWSRTKAYALGFTGLYLNLSGREPYGIVSSAEAPRLLAEIQSRLNQTIDPLTGSNLGRAVLSSDAYSGSAAHASPDLLLAYTPGYRVSDNSILGGFSEDIFKPRTNKWAADHCMEPSKVPGVLLSSHHLNMQDPAIWDLAPTILAALGIDFASGTFDGKSAIV